MKFITDTTKGILGGPDPQELWSEIIDNIPDNEFTKDNFTVFNFACGHSTEADLIVKKMSKLGVKKETINNNITLLDKYKVFTKEAKRKGYKNVIQSDFMDWETEKQFSFVIAGPPFQKDTSHGKKVNDNLWAPMTFKAWDLVEEGGYLALVVPDGWRTPTNDYRTKGLSILKEIIKPYNTVSINLNEAEKHFNVGSSISYFVVQKTKTTVNKTKVVSAEGDSVLDLNNFPTIPGDTSQLGLSVFGKVMSYNCDKWNFFQKQTKLNKSLDVSSTKDKKHPYLYFDAHGKADLKYCDKQGENHNDSKIMITYVGRYKVGIDRGNITPAQHVHRELLPEESLKGAYSQLTSNLYMFLIAGNKSNQYTEKHILNMLPKLDLNREWSDKLIYKEFSLDKKEIEYIENCLKSSKFRSIISTTHLNEI